jgi:hypothetical protein
MIRNQSDPTAGGGKVFAGQPSGSQSKARRQRVQQLWRRSVLGAATATASLAALTLGAGAAHADTLANGPTVQLSQYSIPSTAPAAIPGGDALPTVPGTLGNPTELFMREGPSGSSMVLGVQGGSSAWGTPIDTETAAESSGQIWRFQLVGYIGLNTQAVQQAIGFGYPSGLLQRTPVYKVINYHPDGTHTCLDGLGGNPTTGTMVDSYGCDPNQVNQTNQLWIIGNTEQSNPMMYSNGQLFYDPSYIPPFPEWLRSDLQTNPVNSSGAYNGNDPDSFIENFGTLEASGWDTTQAPVLSASYTDTAGLNSRIWLQTNQQVPVTTDNSTWLVYDTTTTKTGSGGGSGSGSPVTCTGFQCLFS